MRIIAQIPAALTVVATIAITGVFIFQVGKTTLSVTQGVWEKTEESINDLASYLDFQSASDAKILCAHVGGAPTWQPRGNSIWTPGGWCSNLPPQGKTALEMMIPDLYTP